MRPVVLTGPRVHGHGLGRETCSLILDFAFKRLGLRRVVYPHFTDNHASAALAKSLGAVREGLLRQVIFKRGKFVDEVVRSILPDEWMPNR